MASDEWRVQAKRASIDGVFARDVLTPHSSLLFLTIGEYDNLERRSDRDRQGDLGARTIRRVPRERAVYVFGPNLTPSLAVGRGETVLFETNDCYSGRVTADPQTYKWADAEQRNPVTGPVFVEGAEVGDVLCVQIQQIRPASSGVAVVRPRAGILGPEVRRAIARVIPITGGRAEIAEGVTAPVRPVIGVIGVASRHGEISSRYPGRHGGNMDTQEMTVGTRLYLPVQVKGALLAMGDVKACMGDGETSGTGIEVAAEVIVRLDTLPGGRFSWPRLETSESCITIASASSVKQAARLAVMEMVRWLQQDREVDFETAYLIVGLCGDLRISQWVNPLVTARVILPRAIMTGAQFRPGIRPKSIPLEERTSSVATVPPLPIETEEPAMVPQSEPVSEVDVPPLSSAPAPATVPVEAAASEGSPLTPDGKTPAVPTPRPDVPRRKRRWRRRRRSSPTHNDLSDQHGEESASLKIKPPQHEEESPALRTEASSNHDAVKPPAAEQEPQPPGRRKRQGRWRRRGRRTPPGSTPTPEQAPPPSPDVPTENSQLE